MPCLLVKETETGLCLCFASYSHNTTPLSRRQAWRPAQAAAARPLPVPTRRHCRMTTNVSRVSTFPQTGMIISDLQDSLPLNMRSIRQGHRPSRSCSYLPFPFSSSPPPSQGARPAQVPANRRVCRPSSRKVSPEREKGIPHRLKSACAGLFHALDYRFLLIIIVSAAPREELK